MRLLKERCDVVTPIGDPRNPLALRVQVDAQNTVAQHLEHLELAVDGAQIPAAVVRLHPERSKEGKILTGL